MPRPGWERFWRDCLGLLGRSGLLWLVGWVSAYASLNSDLNHFFNQAGMSHNVTASHAYQSQSAGYYTGGSLYARSAVRNVPLAHIDLPTWRSGCGGIDLYTGGFSFINSKELVNLFRNIMNNAVGYAFNLALESATPEIANALKYLNSLASQINQWNINSCETAAGLVGSLWPRTQVAQSQVCQDIGTSDGLFADYAAARQGCGGGGKMSPTLNRAKGPYQQLVLGNSNLAWLALKQNSLFRDDPELAMVLMSFSGSFIFIDAPQKGAGPLQHRLLPPLIANASLLNALLHGGPIELYHCDELTHCLNPTKMPTVIQPENAFQNQVRQLLSAMVEKIELDQPLNEKEIGLLNATTLPLYKMLNVQRAFAPESKAVDLESYADVIALDILFQYLEENIALMEGASALLSYPEDYKQAFLKQLQAARQRIDTLRGSPYAQLALSNQLIERTQLIEKMLFANLATQIGHTLTWANQVRAGV